MSRRKLPPNEYKKLKKEAKKLGRSAGIPHVEALDRIATREGFKNWWHLHHSADFSVPSVPAAPEPGERSKPPNEPSQGPTHGGSKQQLLELVEQYGQCRSQSQKGSAFAYCCILWHRHPGNHRNFGKEWTDSGGFMPSPAEIAQLQQEEASGTVRPYKMRNGELVEVEFDDTEDRKPGEGRAKYALLEGMSFTDDEDAHDGDETLQMGADDDFFEEDE